MFRTIVWFIYFWLYQIIALFFLIKIYFLKKFSTPDQTNAYIHKVTHNWAKAMVRATGSKIHVKGLENVPSHGPVLFVSNHQGNFDIPILMGFIDKPKGFIAKIELSKLPLVHTWMKLIQCVFMDRKDLRQSLKAMDQGIQILKSGQSMVIFPEGTRSKGGPMGEFKKGSLRLAQKTNVPIVPIAISGSYKIMEERGFRITPAEVDVRIGKPILLQELPQDMAKNAIEFVESTIKDLLYNS
ncbi:lysophospholipid acyltransferase family protein [Defluviitalea saccharophila]|uniref:1-acyl-sn-glycerol-3-phosphate acyltransferase n=1 Tax=Defluviitalea saccharophila TaxID=879970 RepID=A0ABZ2XZZ3_9FIRM